MAGCSCGHNDNGEKQKEFEKLMTKFKGAKGALIPLLQDSQEIFGYLPAEVMQQISKSQGIPFSKTFGVATFYAQFHLKPRGRNIIRVCQGTACHVRGGSKVFASIQESLGVKVNESTADLRYTLESVACIGACGLAPVISINDDTHGKITPGRAVEVLAEYK